MFCTGKSALKRCEGGADGFRAPENAQGNNISGVRRALDVCLIIFYAVNLLLVIIRLLGASETERYDGDAE
jgi:hypothetical protein